jgi:hypothetical protein
VISYLFCFGDFTVGSDSPERASIDNFLIGSELIDENNSERTVYDVEL